LQFALRAGGRRLATAGAAFLLLGAVSTAVAVMPDARAESGRRICVYEGNLPLYNKDGKLIYLRSRVVDYKKDAFPECPTSFLHGLRGTYGGSSKFTCEKFALDL
jgi:hypothetical protein